MTSDHRLDSETGYFWTWRQPLGTNKILALPRNQDDLGMIKMAGFNVPSVQDFEVNVEDRLV